MMKVICVHGIAQEGKTSEQLKVEWDAALLEGLGGTLWPKDIDTHYPTYADTLASKTADVDKGEAVGLIRRGISETENREKFAFYEEVLTEIAHGRRIATDGLTGADGDPVERGVLNWWWVQALARRLNKVSAIANLSIDTFTHDVWAYLNYIQVRDPVDAIVDKAIPIHEPCVVVAHSMGTIVTYNVLMARAHRNNILAWVTLGSPLGIKAINNRLPSLIPKIARKAPSGVGLWYNARDPEDFVALNPIEADHFGGLPRVQHTDHVDNKTRNQHGISGYLSDRLVAANILEAATSSLTKR
jgi:pimeloyl-ACP methyl ester carboxylesterase